MTYDEAVKLQALRSSLNKHLQHAQDYKLEHLKRWGQKDCEHCGGPLETLTSEDGTKHIRICMKCEDAANERANAIYEKTVEDSEK